MTNQNDTNEEIISGEEHVEVQLERNEIQNQHIEPRSQQYN